MFKHNLTPVLNTQRPDRSGKMPLRFRATIKGKVSYYPSGIALLPEHWDAKAKKVVVTSNRHLLNASISQQLADLEKTFIESALLGGTPTKITNRFADFIEYANHKLRQQAADFSAETLKSKRTHLSKLKQFRPSIKFSEINADFLRAYEDYCRGIGNVKNTVWNSVKFLKVYINTAVADGYLKPDTLRGYEGVKYENPERHFLTPPELLKIDDFAKRPDIPGEYRSAANWFLFCCYSGLRYGDAAAFDPGWIKNGRILYRTKKTGSDVTVKVHPKLSDIIKRLDGRLTSNQNYNRNLKAVGLAAGIAKRITSHIARHTFAVLFLDGGGHMEELQKLLGHKKLDITAIYGKITNKRLDDAVMKAFK